jgi:hypothetical protein
MKNKYTPWIEHYAKYWGPEFADLLGIEYKPEHDEIVAMACYTMLSDIAAEFHKGEHFDEIMAQWSKE